MIYIIENNFIHIAIAQEHMIYLAIMSLYSWITFIAISHEG